MKFTIEIPDSKIAQYLYSKQKDGDAVLANLIDASTMIVGGRSADSGASNQITSTTRTFSRRIEAIKEIRAWATTAGRNLGTLRDAKDLIIHLEQFI